MPRIPFRPAGFDARPYRPSSLRAQARRNYVRAAASDDLLRASRGAAPAYRAPDALQFRAPFSLPLQGGGSGWGSSDSHCIDAAQPPPTHPPSLASRASAGDLTLPGGGKHWRRTQAEAEQQLTPLTQQVQELYESSAVPVREIARLVGVHERTLYKYVQKYRWRRRYAVPGAAEKPKPPRPPSRFSAQPRGAGGRYVARDRAPAPALHGLKALDPAGAARAAAACAHAKKTSDAAVARARLLREKLSNLRALILLLRAERDLAAVAAAQRAHAARRAAATAAAAARHEELRRTLAEKLAALAAQAGAAPAQPAPSSVAPAAPPAPPSPRIRAL